MEYFGFSRVEMDVSLRFPRLKRASFRFNNSHISEYAKSNRTPPVKKSKMKNT
jgi:hypothetical protein